MVKILQTKNIPTVKTYAKVYNKFRGVDFSTDGSRINDSRSPDSLNMISDSGGFPVKRLGWRTLYNSDGSLGNCVHGLFFYADNHYIAHIDDKLYRWSDETIPTVLKSGIANSGRSSSFLFQEKLYLLTGAEYLVYDGETVKDVGEIAYVPTTTSAAQPSGGGTILQEVNMLTPKRKNTFVADGTAKAYQLDAKEITAVDEVKVNDTVKTVTTDYTVDLEAGKVNFVTAPAAPNPAGIPNVEIIFSKNNTEKKAKISKCTIATIYANRVFFTGNPDYPNTDFASGLKDPSYISDLAYTEIGNDGAAIMGYLRIGENLAIIKEDNSQDATVFLRSYSLTSEEAIFPVKQGIAGIGAVSRYCFANLIDDPLFLTRRGVYAIATQTVTLEKTMQTRSGFADAKLTKENLPEAVACEWNGYYLLCVGDHAYVADSRQRSYKTNVTGTYEYEWYYWENFPAHVLLEDKGSLYFGTTDGRICKLNTDRLDQYGDPLMTAYSDDGQAILARWSTPVSDDDSFMTYKTMPKRGCGLYLKTYVSSSVKIYIVTDKDFGNMIRKVNAGIFDFEQIDFENLTFNTLPQNVIPFNKKTKKYKTVQIKVENDALNEGFGIFAIERKFTRGTSVKR